MLDRSVFVIVGCCCCCFLLKWIIVIRFFLLFWKVSVWRMYRVFWCYVWWNCCVLVLCFLVRCLIELVNWLRLICWMNSGFGWKFVLCWISCNWICVSRLRVFCWVRFVVWCVLLVSISVVMKSRCCCLGLINLIFRNCLVVFGKVFMVLVWMCRCWMILLVCCKVLNWLLKSFWGNKLFYEDFCYLFEEFCFFCWWVGNWFYLWIVV